MEYIMYMLYSVSNGEASKHRQASKAGRCYGTAFLLSGTNLGRRIETGGANVGAHLFFGAGAPGGPRGVLKWGTPISAPNLVTVLGNPMVLRYTYFRKPTGRGVQCHVSAENTKKGSRMHSRAFPSALLRVLWQDYWMPPLAMQLKWSSQFLPSERGWLRHGRSWHGGVHARLVRWILGGSR